jgi:hypothetical protein
MNQFSESAVLDKIERLTDWSQPMPLSAIPEGADVIKVDEEWPGPELNIYENAAEVVREAGEYALLSGLHELYRTTRIQCPGFPIPMLGIEAAKELLGQCLAATNELIEKSAGVPPTMALMSQPVAPPQEETVKAVPMKERTTEEKQALAIGLLTRHLVLQRPFDYEDQENSAIFTARSAAATRKPRQFG